MPITINLTQVSYPITIEDGLRFQIKSRLQTMQCNRLAIVTDNNVWALYGDMMLSELSEVEYELTVLEPGEISKSPENLMKLYQSWLRCGLTRKDLVLAFGGGVIGDLTGYAAATYLRGIDFIQIPTTLLSQVDSSIGGKVAVDLPEGKNLIGTFYHPKEVWIDPEFLLTLPKRVYKDGMAEVVKAACIMDQSLYESLEVSPLPLESHKTLDMIQRAILVKKHLVEIDEKEMSLRKLLNFGHTIGHAIEAYGEYQKWTHGEAVAVGMVWITQCSEALGITEIGTSERLERLLEKIGLPTQVEMSLADLMQWIDRDKKKTSKGLELALIEKPGTSCLREVPQEGISHFLLAKRRK